MVRKLRHDIGSGSRPGGLGRIVLAVLAGIIGVLLWAGLASGTQPYATYESTVAADGPVAQYRFDDAVGSSTLVDSAGSYTATNSGIVLGGEGPFGGSKSGSFGGSAFASLPSNPLAGATAFSAEGWVDWTGGASYKQPIFDFGSSSTNYMYLTPASALTSHTMLFEIRTTAGTVFQVTAPTLKSKAWEYVAVTETSAGTLTLYLNGTQVGQATGVTITPASLGTLSNDWLGKSQVASDPLFNGATSNVAFYTKALSAEQIKAHYNAAKFPVNTVLPSISGTPQDGQTLTATAGTWSGLTPITFTYQWTRCEPSGAACSNIASATKTTYKATPEDVGRTLRIAVTASNTAGSSSASSNQTTTVAPLPPANTKLPALSGTAKDGQVLSVSNGTWTGTPPLSYAYQWEACNSSGAGCASIPGATASTYRTITSQIGGTLRAVVTASNAGGSASATSTVSAVIAAGAPVNTALPEVSGTAMEGQTLSAGTGTWAGTAPFTYTYQWEKCNSAGESCANISGATSSTYVPGSSNVGTTLRVIVTAKNASGSAKATSSATAVVVAKAPANTALPVISGTAQDGQTLSANTGSWSGVTPFTYSYQWQRCNSSGESCSNISGATSSTYVLGHGDVGTTLRVVVTAKNTAGSASASSTASAIVAALAPANTAVPVISGTARDGQTLSASTGQWAGTPPLTYTYQWQSCNTSGASCSNISGATSSTYVLGHGDVGSTLRVTVTASNTAGSASAGSAASAVVSALAPSNTAAPAITGTAQDGQTLTASTGTWSGTPTISYSYQWQSCNTSGGSCANISGATSSTYVLGHGDVGTRLRVMVTATNAGGSASNSSEASSVVAALAPSNTVAPAISGTAKDGQTLTASTGSWTGTPPLSYAYQWQSCNSLGEGCVNISGATSSTYVVGHNDVGTTLSVRVTATNAAGSDGATSQPSAVVVGLPVNTAAPAITGAARDGQTLTAGTGTWSGTPPISYAYQWQSCNSADESCSDISEATGSSYVLGHGDVGTTLRVVVTATNSVGSASSTSETTAVVAALAPSNTTAPAISGEAKQGQTLTASTGSWTGTPPLTYTYQWQSCDSLGQGCLDISGATASSHTLGSGEVGMTIRVIVTATNPAGSASATSEATAVVEGSGSGGPLVYSAQFGSGGSGNGQFSHPGDIAVDSTGDLFVLDQGNDRVEVFNDAGEYLRQFGSAGSGTGQLSGPDGLAIDSKDDVWVADTGNRRAVEFNSKGEYLRSAGSGQVGVDEGIAVDRHDDVWVSDTSAGDLAVFKSQGENLKTVGSKGSAAGQIGEPEGLAVDSKGHVWVADWSNNRVEEFNEEGDFIQQFGVAGSGEGQLRQPYGIAVGPAGVFVGEVGNDRVQQFTDSGEPISELGSSGSGPGQLSLSYPMGVAVANEDVRVTDSNNNRVEEWAPEVPAAPSNTSSPSISGEPFEGQTLTASTGTWTGTPPPSYSYRWQSCNSEGDECANIAGASSQSYVLGRGDVGRTVQVLVTAANSLGSATAASPPTAVIATPVSPSNTTPPAISGTAQDGQTLSASTGAWTATPSATYIYQWQSCNSTGEDCSNISGATSSTYALGNGDVGTTLRVIVEATNLAGSAMSTSEATAVVAALAPSNIEAPTITGQAQDERTLNARTGTWTGTPPLTYTYQWESCDSLGEGCLDISEATSSSYTLGAGEIGETLRVIVTAANSVGSASDTSAATRVVSGPSACTDTWTDEAGGSSWQTAGNWSTGSAPGPSDVACIPSGATVQITGGTNSVGSIIGEGSLVISGGSLELAEASTTSTVMSLTLRHATLTGAGSLDVSSAFSLGAYSTMSGSGETVVGPGVSGEIYASSGCEPMNLIERKLVNEGTLTYGWGTLFMSEGARLENKGTFEDNTEASCYGTQIQASGGAAPSVLNTGTFEKTSGGGTSTVAVNFGNQGAVEAKTGTLDFSDGGVPEETADGSWTIQGRASIVLNGGTFLVGEEADLSAVRIEGATVTVVGFGSPSSSSVPFISGEPFEGQTLSASSGHWKGMRPLGYGYQWQSCNSEGDECADIAGATSENYAIGSGDVGSTLRVLVTATNTLGSAAAASQRTAVVSTPVSPSSTSPPAITGTVQDGQTLSASTGVWTAAPSPTYAYQWQACNSAGESCANISGATSSTYALGHGDVGTTLRVTVEATNFAGSASSTSEATSVVAALAPGNTAAPAISGETTEGQALTAGTGSWTGTPPLSYAYRWQSCDVSGEECADIEGATEREYRLGAGDVGTTLRVIVTAENSAGSASSASKVTAVVVATPPSDATPPSISGTAQDGQTLSANTGIWEGTQPISYAYQWQSCDGLGEGCFDVAGATGSSYTLGSGDVGGTIEVIVTATNAAGSAASTSELTVVVTALAPSNTISPSLSGQTVAGRALGSGTGSWTGSAPLSYRYQWQSCNAAGGECTNIEGATSATYTLGGGDIGTSVRSLVTASNSGGSATAASSPSSVVSPAIAPSNTAAPTISGTARDGQTLLAETGSWEGTTPIFSYQWQSCNPQAAECQDLEGQTEATYTLASGDVGTSVRVLVTATNAASSTQATSAATAEVKPGPPSELEAPSVTGIADAGEVLSAHPGEWGGAEVGFGYQWQSCNPEGAECQDIAGATESGYTLGAGDVGATLRVRIMASNEQASLAAVSVPTAVIGSKAPTLTVNFSPSISGTTQSGHTLTVDSGSWTGEGQVTYAYAWQRCDVNGSGCEAIAGAKAESLSLDSQDIGSTVRVLVTATDANGSLTQTTPVTQPVAAEGSPVLEEAPTVHGTTLEGQTIDATPGTWMAEVTPLTYTYQWERCDEDGGACQTIAGATGNTRAISGADVGSTLRVLATAHSAEGEATAVSSATASVAPGSLTAISAPSISGAVETGHPLSADAGIWTALGPITYAYKWERCDASGGSCTEISGATASSYTPTAGDLGDSIRVAIEATDGQEKATSHSTATVAVISPHTPPENTLAPSIEGTLTAGETLTASAGAWAGAEPIAYAYQWQSCSPTNQECADIEGATGATYVLGEGDVSTSIRLIVTATNSLASTIAASGESEVVGAPGPPAVVEDPTIFGTAKEGAKVFVANGNWSGTRPLRYRYQWERCNDTGEACANIETATKPSYQLQSADVGSTVRVRVTVTNSVGEASSVSAQVAVTVDGQPSAAQAIEAAEQTDPSLLAPSSGATLDEQQIKPAITDSGEELSSESVLNSSTISKQTTGEFAVNTPAGDLGFEPAASSPGATTLPTIVNGAAAVFADSSTATDTILRPEPLGAIDILQLLSTQAPTSFSWQVHIGPTQQLEQLPDGGVAVIESSSEGEGDPEGGESHLSMRFMQGLSPARPAAPRFASPLGTSEGEGVDGHAAEKEFEESLTEQGSSSTLPAAPTASTAEAPAPVPGELNPSNTQAEYETATSELAAAKGHVTGNVLMVIAPPTVKDAERHSVPASLSVHGETITLTLSPAENAAYPLSAETAVAGSSKQSEALPQLRAFDFKANTAKSGARLYGLSASYETPQDFDGSETSGQLDKRLTDGTGKMHVSVARIVVPYNLKPETAPWNEVVNWLAAVGKTPGLKPFITFGDPLEHYYCAETKLKECQEDRPKSDKEYGENVKTIIEGLMNVRGLPPVKYWGAWNEPDLNYGTKKDLYYNDAPGAALIWRYAESALKASGCASCYMIAGEFAEYNKKYVGEFKNTIVTDQNIPVAIGTEALKPGKPIIWGLHDYHDLVHFSEHHTNTAAPDFINALSSVHPRIWLSELGVELENGSTLTALQTGKRGNRPIKHPVHGKLKNESPNELQTEAANDFLTLGTLPHVEMLDYYQYRAHSEFDSALLNPTGKEPRDWREAYCVLALGKSRGCPAWVKPHSTILPKPKTPTTAKAASIVDPRGLPTEYWLEYGETPAYGQETARTALPNETGEQSVTSALSGLKPCTTYHYQVEAENEGNEGEPSLGGDEKFTTPCGRAVVEDPRCTANVLPANDDNSTGLVSLPFTINFYGKRFSGLYVNNNGNVTFDEALRQWTPYRFSGSSRPIMAPFLGDVDTRGGKREEGGGGRLGGTANIVRASVTSSSSSVGGGGSEGESGESGLTSYGDTTFEGRPAFCVDWPYVGYYYKHTDKLNDIQLMLVNRSDLAPGDFEMIFNYDQVQWETGDFNGGSDGLGGTSAGVGFSNGAGDTYEFPGSREPGALLDSNATSGLIYGDRGSPVPGRYIFDVFAGG